MIFDTHCHYSLEPISLDIESFLIESNSVGIISSIVPSTNEANSILTAHLATKYPSLHPCIGIHPSEVSADWLIDGEKKLFNLFEQANDIHPITAIGETGLDLFRLDPNADEIEKVLSEQLASLSHHLRLAKQAELPLIAHVRDSSEKAYWNFLEAWQHIGPEVTVILHCVSGPQSYVQQAVELGAYVSFAGNVTYPSNQHLRTLATTIPTSSILVETDAPYLAPQQYRGKVCRPSYITETVDCLQSLGVSESQLFENSLNAFRLTVPSNT